MSKKSENNAETIRNIVYSQKLDYLMSLGYSEEEADDIIQQQESEDN